MNNKTSRISKQGGDVQINKIINGRIDTIADTKELITEHCVSLRHHGC